MSILSGDRFFSSSSGQSPTSSGSPNPNPNLTNGESPPPKEIPDMSSATFVSVVSKEQRIANVKNMERGSKYLEVLSYLEYFAFWAGAHFCNK